MNFVALDVETANPWRGSICEIGLAFFTGGPGPMTLSRLIDPEEDFHPILRKIHGISAEAVAGKPKWPEVWQDISPLLAGKLIVAHNAQFDVGALQQAGVKYGLTGVSAQVIDTMYLARLVWPELTSFGLEYLVNALGISVDSHHRAGDDALAAGLLLTNALEECKVDTIDQLLDCVGTSYGWLGPDAYTRMQRPLPGGKKWKPKLSTMEGNPDADHEHPLYGKTICFTGGLDSMPRETARQMACDCGANYAANLTKSVDFLVLGNRDFGEFAAGRATGKLTKAQANRALGLPIEILGETDFLEMVSISAQRSR